MGVVRDHEPWDALLDAGRADERLVRQAHEHDRGGTVVPLPQDLHPDVLKALARRGDRLPLGPPGRGAGGGVRGHDDRHHRHRVRQVAVLPAPDAATMLSRDPTRAGAVPVPVEGARAGPGAVAARVRASSALQPGDLRRRHAARAPRRAAPARQPHPHQPGHAAPRDPPEPRGVGRLLQRPGGGRGRRGARVPRRVRLARGQRAAAAAADLRVLRHGAALPARLGDGRQPRRAGDAADRARRRAA